MKELSLPGNKNICSTIALIRGTKILTGLRHYTAKQWKDISVWTIPGGRCDEGETIGTTLQREVAEEVGITDFKNSHFLGTLNGVKEGDLIYLFVGTTTQEARNMEPEKFSEWSWIDINSMPKNFINPKALALIKKFLHQ